METRTRRGKITAMIYTSYFGNWRNFPPDAILVSVARYKPSHFKGLSALQLAPSEDLLKRFKNHTASEGVYREEYWRQLCHLDKEKVFNQLDKLGSTVILLCYEKPQDFCHRHILAEWLNISEYGE